MTNDNKKRRVKPSTTYPCAHCHKVFRSNSTYHDHVYMVHKRRFFTCDKCGAKMQLHSQKSYHAKLHPGGTTFTTTFHGKERLTPPITKVVAETILGSGADSDSTSSPKMKKPALAVVSSATFSASSSTISSSASPFLDALIRMKEQAKRRKSVEIKEKQNEETTAQEQLKERVKNHEVLEEQPTQKPAQQPVESIIDSQRETMTSPETSTTTTTTSLETSDKLNVTHNSSKTSSVTKMDGRNFKCDQCTMG